MAIHELSTEQLNDLLLLISDNIETKQKLGSIIPGQWLEKRSTILALLDQREGGDAVEGDVFPLQVFGHPLQTPTPGFEHLVPIRVRDAEAIETRIDWVQKKIDEIQLRIGTNDAISKKRIPATAAKFKAAQAYLRSSQFSEDELYLERMRAETMPELSRVLKLLEARAKKAAAAA